MKIPVYYILISALLSAGAAAESDIPVDLSAFSADPAESVLVQNGTVEMLEAPLSIAVFFANDPASGDSGIVLPAGATALTFDYIFDREAGGNDTFRARILAEDGSDILGSGSSLVVTESTAGTHSWDLRGLAAWTLIGLEFQMASADIDPYIDSGVTIENVTVTVAGKDSDNDGRIDSADNCPLNANPDQADADEDDVGDACDNCPDTANPDQNPLACEVPVQCDADSDGDIDRADIRSILRARGQPASGPDDPMDADGDGEITRFDATFCARRMR